MKNHKVVFKLFLFNFFPSPIFLVFLIFLLQDLLPLFPLSMCHCIHVPLLLPLVARSGAIAVGGGGVIYRLGVSSHGAEKEKERT